MKIATLFQLGKSRQNEIEALCRKGIAAAGHTHARQNEADCLITWGRHRGNAQLVLQYRAENKPVIIFDLGYWGRKILFKASVNQPHPRDVLDEAFTGERYEATNGIPIEPPRDGGSFVLLAAMGWKGCAAYGQAHGAWDASAYKRLQKATTLPIVWKAKPSDPHPIVPEGVTPYRGGKMLNDYPLEDCAAIVTHHGNSAVEALARGIPAFCVHGVASEICGFDLSKIGTAKVPQNRVQFLHNLAHWQWSKDEIASGALLNSYIERGLIHG